jgi:high-affinity iron transporter
MPGMTERQRVGVAVLVWVCLAAPACGSLSAGSADEGRALYGSNGCVTCHGQAGHGDGPVAKTLVPAPRDFRDAGAFKNGTDVPAIARTLDEGLARNGVGMPRFNHLTEHERRSIALFVRSLHEDVSERTSHP